MIEILIFSFLITLLFTPFGIIFQKGGSLRTFSLQLIYGLILISRIKTEFLKLESSRVEPKFSEQCQRKFDMFSVRFLKAACSLVDF